MANLQPTTTMAPSEDGTETVGILAVLVVFVPPLALLAVLGGLRVGLALFNWGFRP